MTATGSQPHQHRIAVIGAGSIGIGLAVVHATHRHAVTVFDPDAAQRDSALPNIAAILDDLASYGLLETEVKSALANVEIASTIGQAVANTCLVHECAPENLTIKRQLTQELDQAAPVNAVIASASSAIMASEFADTLQGRRRCLIAHPGNPPFLIPVVEIVPAAFTAPEAVQKATSILTAAGMSPVHVRKELRGFVFNRLQGALLREAYCLVRDDVAAVEDIDRIVRDGLGLRWSVIGPFETVDLNTRGGIERHAELLGPAYAAMGAERGQHDPWTKDLVAKVTSERRALLPADKRDARIRWRDRQLMRLLACRRA